MTQRDSHIKPFDFASAEESATASSGRGRGWALVLFIVVLLCAGVAYLWYFDRERANRWLDNAPNIMGPSETTAYKWRDAKGNWQITDQPPTGDIPYETVRVRSDVNIMPSLKEDQN